MIGPRAFLTFSLMLATTVSVTAQPPVRPGRPPEDRGGTAGSGPEAFIIRMLTLDADKDGKLSKDEVHDARLHALLERADANRDGLVTRDELAALHEKEAANLGRGGQGGPPGGFGPGAGGPEFGGPGGRGGSPMPGQLLPPFLQDELRLSEQQRDDLAKLQREVEERIAKILTPGQNRQLNELRRRGPGGPPPGERGGRPPRGDQPQGDRPPRDGERPRDTDRPRRPADE